MKNFIAVIILLYSYQAQAVCRCTCDMMNASLCASSYDLDHPCNGLCPSAGPTFPAMRTACPVMQVHDPNTGTNIWISTCSD